MEDYIEIHYDTLEEVVHDVINEFNNGDADKWKFILIGSEVQRYLMEFINTYRFKPCEIEFTTADDVDRAYCFYLYKKDCYWGINVFPTAKEKTKWIPWDEPDLFISNNIKQKHFADLQKVIEHYLCKCDLIVYDVTKLV